MNKKAMLIFFVGSSDGSSTLGVAPNVSAAVPRLRSLTMRDVARCTAFAVSLLGLIACGADDPEEAHHDEHEAEPVEVTLSDVAIARAGITVGEVTRSSIGGGVGVPAEIQADPAYTTHVASVVASRIISVEVGVGDRVERGQLLASIASSDVSASRAALSAARVRREAARVARDRQASLVEAGIGAQRALVEADAELASAEAEMRGLSGSLRVVGRGGGAGVMITAPIAGVIVERHAVAGEVVDAGAPLFTITDPARLWVVGFVPELDLAFATHGATATLSVAALPGERWVGHIDYVAPALDERTRTLGVRAVLDTVDPRLRAGLFGRLTIAAAGAEPTALVVPADALARIGGEDVVFAPAGEAGTFRPIPVRVGRRDGTIVEIVEGLSEGDAIVTAGSFTLRSEFSRGELAEHED